MRRFFPFIRVKVKSEGSDSKHCRHLRNKIPLFPIDEENCFSCRIGDSKQPVKIGLGGIHQNINHEKSRGRSCFFAFLGGSEQAHQKAKPKVRERGERVLSWIVDHWASVCRPESIHRNKKPTALYTIWGALVSFWFSWFFSHCRLRRQASVLG